MLTLSNCGVMFKAMDSGIVVSVFELQSRYYVQFRTNTLGKCINPHILPSIGYIAPLLFFSRMALLLNNLQIIIIIMSCRPQGYPRSSLDTFPYRSSPPVGLLDYIPYLHIAAVCMFEPVVLLLLGHKLGSIEVRHL